ncbi:MAG: PilZ domain-containing protein [Phycisphaerales bacterium]|nr:PilZ domain-containing protein [Phycisphaerales bacterium]
MSRPNSFRFERARAMKPRHVVEQDPFKLERRRLVREEAEGVLRASYSVPATDDQPARFGITQIKLVDRSPGGLGAIAAIELEPGMSITICPEGSSIAWLSARVARCERIEEGFRIGLRYADLAAA